MGFGEQQALFAFFGGAVTEEGSGGWPHLEFGDLPDLAALRALVHRVRLAVMGEAHVDGALDVERLCQMGGFNVTETALHAAEGRLQALLFPRASNQFSVYVDPEPPGGWSGVDPRIQSELHEHRLRFRICHEVAHSFFFDREGDLPASVVGPSADQEKICDRFASELLIPRAEVEALTPEAAAVVELHRRFRVSLEVAARAFADVHLEALVVLIVGDGSTEEVQWTNRPDAVLSREELALSEARLERRRQTVLVGAP